MARLKHGGAGDRSLRRDSLLRKVAELEQDLRRYAHWLVARAKVPHSFQGTDLVSHTALRLIERDDGLPVDPIQAKCAFGREMSRALVDSIRRRARAPSAAEVDAAQPRPTGDLHDREMLLDLADALAELREIDPHAWELVQLLFFGGMTQAEASRALGVSERTVRTRWSAIRKTLDRLLQKGGGRGD